MGNVVITDFGSVEEFRGVGKRGMIYLVSTSEGAKRDDGIMADFHAILHAGSLFPKSNWGQYERAVNRAIDHAATNNTKRTFSVRSPYSERQCLIEVNVDSPFLDVPPKQPRQVAA